MSGTPQLEVADVIRAYGPALLAERDRSVTAPQRRVLTRLAACRTPALGGHVAQCDRCNHRHIVFRSCRNRHCPKCLAHKSVKWVHERTADLLDIPYFHVVFTLPAELRPLALPNKKVVFEALLRATAETLQDVARDPRRLGAELGFITVLHTWGQTLVFHPHVHCVVTGGGLSRDGERWISSRPRFLFPVRVLSKVFRGKFLHLIAAAHARGQLSLDDALAGIRNPSAFTRWIDQLRPVPWVVYCKPPFDSPDHVVKYLARYTHRIAIANTRLVGMHDGVVQFRYKDYARGDAHRVMSLPATEFLRRFLLHVLPKGFQRIRHYGLLASRGRVKKLQRCRELLARRPVALRPTVLRHLTALPPPIPPTQCPVCRIGTLVVIEILLPVVGGAPFIVPRDTS